MGKQAKIKAEFAQKHLYGHVKLNIFSIKDPDSWALVRTQDEGHVEALKKAILADPTKSELTAPLLVIAWGKYKQNIILEYYFNFVLVQSAYFQKWMGLPQDVMERNIAKGRLTVYSTGGNHSKKAGQLAFHELQEQDREYVKKCNCNLFLYPSNMRAKTSVSFFLFNFVLFLIHFVVS